MVAYSVWDYSSVIKGAPPALPIMKADDTSDEDALAALVAILSPALDAVEERLRAKMHGRAVDEFRSFLDDVRETFPVGAWEARS
jgi:trehalose-6-phosphatase